MSFSVIRDAGGNDRAVSEPSMESSGVEVLRRGNEDCPENTRSHGSTLRKKRITTEVACCMMGLTRGEYDSEERKRSKEEKEPEGSDNPRGSSSSVREAERRSLFHSIPDRADFSTSIEHLCQDV